MIFLNDVKFVKVWEVEVKEKFIKLQVSTGDKKQDGSYENSGWYLNLVGQAHEQGKNLKKGDTITIKKGKITNVYNKDHKKSFLNLVAFDIEAPVVDKDEAIDDFQGFQSMEDDSSIPF